MAPDPAWLTTLKEGLFAALPEHEESWTHDGTTYTVHREIRYTAGGTLDFRESWYDPRTLQLQQAWSVPLNAGGFVALPPWLMIRTIAELRAGIAASRPRAIPRTPQDTVNPQRFVDTRIGNKAV